MLGRGLRRQHWTTDPLPRCRYHSLDRRLSAQHGPPACV